MEVAEPEPVAESTNLVDLMKLLEASVKAATDERAKATPAPVSVAGCEEGAGGASVHGSRRPGRRRDEAGRRGRRRDATGTPPQERLSHTLAGGSSVPRLRTGRRCWET